MRKLTLLLAVLIIQCYTLFGCEATQMTSEQTFKTSVPIENGKGLNTVFTLSQAQSKVTFPIHMPQYLPDGMTFQSAEIGYNTYFVSKPNGDSVILKYSTPDHSDSFAIIEQSGLMGHLQNGVVKNIKLSSTNNVAEFTVNNQQFEASILFSIDSVVYCIITYDKKIGNEEELVQIANSVHR